MAIPSVIKSVFDSVPLKTYPDHSSPVVSDQVYYFQGGGNVKLFLGVFNVFEYEGKIIPTDPISLGTSLILAFKNGFKLPTPNTSTSNSGILKMSFYGSPNNCLPVLIEDNESRTIRTLDAINNSISTNNIKDIQAKLVNDLIDTKFYDVWILCLLAEDLPFDTLSQIYDLKDSVMSRAELIEFKQEVALWHNFSRRYPNLSTSQLSHLYHQRVTEFETDLELVIDYLQENHNEILEFKVAGYVIIIDHFLKSTKLGSVVSSKPFTRKFYDLLN
ncbi:Sorting assembly machinery (SAM) complex subunit of the mitochondrial outer membrane, putative [Candida maltosa Xu316]|uniref:Sorting assembly machinery (SAM) complex subunit of the mitochondrial outer membrane, putative n=1 Tax=Candida maltosa (strain Xu316) TaxID=1245528 RepID=M3K412_CANMX|nr:Sorting assembly machinery (SAM) complex subunit of the mitochondrial outer membrane, putative [Candida maltosa Xu316]